MSLPGRRPYRVCFVCSGNICRSPTAEVVFRTRVAEAGLEQAIETDSAGTGDWHVGHGADERSLTTLAGAGYDGSTHRARQFEARWFGERDLVVALDRGHQEALRSLTPDPAARKKVRLLRSFDPDVAEADPPDVADPYFGGQEGFTLVLEQVEAACRGLLAHVRAELDR